MLVDESLRHLKKFHQLIKMGWQKYLLIHLIRSYANVYMKYALTFSLSAELHAAVKSLEENNTLKTKVESLKRDVGELWHIRSLFLTKKLFTFT